MKKLFSILVCLSLLLSFGRIAFAGSFDREDADEAGYVDTKTLSSDTANTIARPCYIYGIQFYAGSTSSHVNIYDSVDISGTARIEVSEATGGDFVYYSPKKPIKFNTAISVDIEGAGSAVVIEYR